LQDRLGFAVCKVSKSRFETSMLLRSSNMLKVEYPQRLA
jgi:hypothetical protein